MTRLTLVSFQRAHLGAFRPQGAQLCEAAFADGAVFGDAWTAMVGDQVLGCGGLIPHGRERAYAWALLADDAGARMLALTRAVRGHLAGASFARIEMAVDVSFAAGARWAELLGFERETLRPLRHYLPGGRSAWLYARFASSGAC